MKHHEESLSWSVIVGEGGSTTIRVGQELREYKTLKQALRFWTRKKDPVWLKADVNRALSKIQAIEER
jgi:hypothetical protein